MRLKLKPLDEQVMVITGASSGIGLVTAKHAAKRGACVVLAALTDNLTAMSAPMK
jgi:NAD(P)-dependent dehydrogenase (short-subunit alcohol dehydrogenase family)